MDSPIDQRQSLTDKVIRFCLENKLVVGLLVIMFVGWGLMSAPFDWDLGGLPRSPVPVDAIPDIGENQQIVFTEWMGRSPQDVEDQITYPLTVSLLGIPGVKTVRSYSFFGFSSIYIIFEDKIDFYWSRSRVLEKLNSLPAGTLPEGVQASLGPDATGLGQIFWYTLEGRDEEGNPAGGWDLDELRSIQDWQVRYALLSAKGISETASVGGFVKEYQIDVDPDAMRAYDVGLDEIFTAVKMSNVDVGARTIEVNRAEYVIRSLGFIKNLSDIERSVIKVNDNVPVYIKDVAKVSYGPALRRGALDKGGAEAVGGVVVVRYGYNPLEAIKNVKAKIEEISPGLPRKTLEDGTVSQVTIVPFYDRTGLIYETLGTLNTALTEEILVTIIVVIVLVVHLRSSVLISGLLPLAVLMCFIAMKVGGVDANVVALSGIAIAIGTMVDMGIIICENILRHLDDAGPDDDKLEVIYRAASEVGGAVLTAVSTTVVSFLPVFTMTGAEGKLFKPLAFTKTFALIASVVVALTIIPPVAHILFTRKAGSKAIRRYLLGGILIAAAAIAGYRLAWWIGVPIGAIALYHLSRDYIP
ncbi:MAG: efflux RND transporter permease subunit, partial [Planctomycetota bacterium]